MYNISKIELSDINRLKKIYNLGEENQGELDFVRFDKNTYNTNLVKSQTFFCDLRNDELVDIIKKYITLDETREFISNIHYINYQEGEEGKGHVDTHSSIRTYIILLSDEFEGGEFYINSKNLKLELGDVLEFNADLFHGVRKIKKGSREVLVIWIKYLDSIKNII